MEEFNEFFVDIELVVSKLNHLLALINERLDFILGSNDEVEELQWVTLAQP